MGAADIGVEGTRTYRPPHRTQWTLFMPSSALYTQLGGIICSYNTAVKCLVSDAAINIDLQFWTGAEWAG